IMPVSIRARDQYDRRTTTFVRIRMVAGLNSCHLADEERLLGGRGGAAGRLFSHRGELERETGWHVHGGSQTAVSRRIEHAEAHRLPLRYRPQLIGAARRRGRQVEHGTDDAVPGG